jgi:hypothetical protein
MCFRGSAKCEVSKPCHRPEREISGLILSHRQKLTQYTERNRPTSHQPVKKYSSSDGIRRFIAVFTKPEPIPNQKNSTHAFISAWDCQFIFFFGVSYENSLCISDTINTSCWDVYFVFRDVFEGKY